MVEYLLVCQTCEPDEGGYSQCIFTNDESDIEAMMEWMENHKTHDVDKGAWTVQDGWKWEKALKEGAKTK